MFSNNITHFLKRSTFLFHTSCIHCCLKDELIHTPVYTFTLVCTRVTVTYFLYRSKCKIILLTATPYTVSDIYPVKVTVTQAFFFF